MPRQCKRLQGWRKVCEKKKPKNATIYNLEVEKNIYAPESIGWVLVVSLVLCTMSRHSQQDKCCKKGWRMLQKCKKLHSLATIFFSRNSLQKMGKKALCYVEFAVVNFVGRIKTAIKKSFQTYSIYSSNVCKGVYGEVTQLCTTIQAKKAHLTKEKLSNFFRIHIVHLEPQNLTTSETSLKGAQNKRWR